MADDFRLLVTHRNEVLKAVQEIGLDPSQFRWRTEKKEEWAGGYPSEWQVSVLVHGSTGFFYVFGRYTDDFSPGADQRVEQTLHDDARFPLRLPSVKRWLGYLKRELATPDLWEPLLEQQDFSRIASDPGLDNAPFRAEEKQYLVRELGQIRDYLVSQHEFLSDQRKAIDAGFASLTGSLDRLGRKDWINYAVGTLVNIAVAAAFAPDVARDMFQRVSAAIQPLFQAALKLIS